MNLLYFPEDWKTVSADIFSAFLGQCPDYHRNSYANATQYVFNNGEEFAYVMAEDGKILINPDLLADEKIST